MLVAEKIIFNNMQFNTDNLQNHNDVEIHLKNKKVYKLIQPFMPKNKAIRILGYTTTFLKCVEKESKNQRIFALIHMPDGVYCSDQINQINLMPKDNLIIAIKKEIGEEYQTKESIFLKRADDGLDISPSYITAKFVEKSFKISMSNYNTKKAYIGYYEKLKGKRFKQSVANLHPDRVMEINGVFTILEAERSFHNRADYMWKLKKLKGLERNFSKIIMLFNGEKNMEYHLELIYLFEKENKTKFKRIYYADMDDFQMKGEAALIHYK